MTEYEGMAEMSGEPEVAQPDAPKKRGRPVGARNKPKEQPQPPDACSALVERIATLEDFAKKKPVKASKKTRQLTGSPTNAARQLCERLQIPMTPNAPGPTASPADAFLDNMHRAREERRHKREEFYASFLPSSR
jgi:hypothetical protein